jgi:hypothetical protein
MAEERTPTAKLAICTADHQAARPVGSQTGAETSPNFPPVLAAPPISFFTPVTRCDAYVVRHSKC